MAEVFEGIRFYIQRKFNFSNLRGKISCGSIGPSPKCRYEVISLQLIPSNIIFQRRDGSKFSIIDSNEIARKCCRPNSHFWFFAHTALRNLNFWSFLCELSNFCDWIEFMRGINWMFSSRWRIIWGHVSAPTIFDCNLFTSI